MEYLQIPLYGIDRSTRNSKKIVTVFCRSNWSFKAIYLIIYSLAKLF